MSNGAPLEALRDIRHPIHLEKLTQNLVMEDQFEASDGFKIHRYCWKPSAAPRAVLHIAHGMAEHAGRYKTSNLDNFSNIDYLAGMQGWRMLSTLLGSW